MSVPPDELEVSLSARALEVVRRYPWATTGAAAAVLGIAIWVYVGVRAALIETIASNLRVLLDTEVSALDIWVREKQLNVNRWSQDARVQAAARELVDDTSNSACRGPSRARLLAAIETLAAGEATPAANLVDRNGRVIATRFDAYCGRSVSLETRARLERVFSGASLFAAPISEQDRLGGVTEQSLRRPLIWFSSPVRDNNGGVIAALNIGKYADERFSAVLAVARLGATGEAYAFDASGRMLSTSRFHDLLEDAGRLRAGESEILNLRLNDPDSEAPGTSLTRLVATAIAGRSDADGALDSGIIVEPYTNYLGQWVVGAWRWLPEFDFAVAIEVGRDEVFAPLVRLERTFIAVLVAAGSTLLFLFVAVGRIMRLRRERDEARRVGNYELLEEVGHGGMARVYRARHRLLKRPTAVKIIELAVASDEMLARFDREVRLASQLMHPNTVEIYDYGRTPEGQPFYAMEFLDGKTLQQIVDERGPLPAPRVAHVLRGIAGSLSEAHERGLVHRDIKPGNVMLCQRGGEFDVVKVLDFGLVKDTRKEATRNLTRALRVLGTPAYMAPERIERPESADFRSDLYALGAVGFFVLAGRSPFTGDDELALAYQVVNVALPDVRDIVKAQLPDELALLINMCLEKDPAWRPQRAADIISALDALLAQSPWTNSDARLWWEGQCPAAAPAAQVA